MAYGVNLLFSPLRSVKSRTIDKNRIEPQVIGEVTHYFDLFKSQNELNNIENCDMYNISRKVWD